MLEAERAMWAVIGLLDPKDNDHLQAAGPFTSKREAERWILDDHKLGTVVELYAPDADD